MSQLSRLLQENTAGDPTGRRGVWTGKRLRRITEELRQLAIRVSPHTVRRLLDQLGYALHANSKSLSASSEQRDEQFGYIAKQKRRFLGRRLPIISVDTKKKELVGNFKNSGRVWSQGPVPVNDHDFRSQAEGLASPYGVYDLARNRGSLFVGVSHDTPEFAADNGATPGEGTIPMLPNCSSWPTAVGVTEPGSELGNIPFSSNWWIGSVCRSPSATIPPEPPSGIPLSIASSVRSVNIGRASLWIVTQPSCV